MKAEVQWLQSEEAHRQRLNGGLAAEQFDGEGAQEGRDAVLLQQVQLDELRHRAGELRLQQLHLGARGSCGLREERREAISTDCWRGEGPEACTACYHNCSRARGALACFCPMAMEAKFKVICRGS